MSGKKRCARCSRWTPAQSGVCRSCEREIAGDVDTLTGGHWAPNSRGVQVWVRDDPAPVYIEPQRPVALDQMIACPTCHAKVTQTCRTKTGNRTHDHGSRIVPRMCPCGEPIDGRASYCAECRHANDLASKARWRARKRLERDAA